jgi:hypothetical protein
MLHKSIFRTPLWRSARRKPFNLFGKVQHDGFGAPVGSHGELERDQPTGRRVTLGQNFGSETLNHE